MGKIKYINKNKIVYYSQRYNRYITVPEGEGSDGATGAIDIDGISWWVHDMACKRGTWDDGTPITNWQASFVLRDILKSEGHPWRKRTWFWMTFLFGGRKIKHVNGWV